MPGGGTVGTNNIFIGAGVVGPLQESNTIHIGDNLPSNPGASACFIGGINGQTTTSGTAVFINSSGKLGTITSSARFKKDIKPMDSASEVILSLRPVTFHYRSDTMNTPQFGLVAEEVARMDPALVLTDKEGKPYTVRYEQVNAMLLNEFLKEHRKVEELEANATRQQKQIEALTAGLQKVSAQLEASEPARQVVTIPNEKEISHGRVALQPRGTHFGVGPLASIGWLDMCKGIECSFLREHVFGNFMPKKP